MKNRIVTVILALCILGIQFSKATENNEKKNQNYQVFDNECDSIVMKSGEVILARNVKIEDGFVYYKLCSEGQGSARNQSILRNKKKSEIEYIVYADGRSGNLNITTTTTSNNTQQNQTNNSVQRNSNENNAANDAYNRYNSAPSTMLTVWATLLNPILGLFTAIMVANTPPKTDNLNMDEEKALNPKYKTEYKDTAYEMKRAAVWAGFGVVAILWFLVIIVILL